MLPLINNTCKNRFCAIVKRSFHSSSLEKYQKKNTAKIYNHVMIGDVTLRDGLQSVKKHISSDVKRFTCDYLGNVGYDYIEVGSVVNELMVPQMKGSIELLNSITRDKNVKYGLLVFDEKRAMKAYEKSHPDVIATVVSPSSEFCRKNMNCTVDEAVERMHAIARYCRSKQILLRVYISTSFECPFTKIPLYRDLPKFITDNIPNETYDVMISDTTGSATAESMEFVIDKLHDPLHNFGLHLHENENIYSTLEIALKGGIRKFDTTFLNMGGCTALKEPHKNLHISKLLFSLNLLGYHYDVDSGYLTAPHSIMTKALGS